MSKVSVTKPGRLWLVSRDGNPVLATPAKTQATKRARKIEETLAGTAADSAAAKTRPAPSRGNPSNKK